jgi:hypothetical protein
MLARLTGSGLPLVGAALEPWTDEAASTRGTANFQRELVFPWPVDASSCQLPK